MARYLQSATLRSLLENPELLNPKTDDNPLKIGEVKKLDQPTFGGQAAFLGPNLWDKTLDFDLFSDDFKVDDAELADFLQVNGLSGSQSSENKDNETVKSTGPNITSSDLADLFSLGAIDPNIICDQTKSTERIDTDKIHVQNHPDDPPRTPPILEKITEAVDITELVSANIPGLADFDPRKKRFTDEELLPQPIIKKSKRVFVDEEAKDDKYWAKRNKNNVAAKRSREARRVKENQIAVRTAFLEKENSVLKVELEKYIDENKDLKSRLARYGESV